MLGGLRDGVRFVTGTRRFLRRPITLEEARGIVQRRLAERERSFLRLVEEGILARPSSPYARLLQNAGIELRDVQSMVTDGGVEGTLERLYDAGVYVTLEELKGREPIVRSGGLEFQASPADFANPFVSDGVFNLQSSGSRGTPTGGVVDFDYVYNEAVYLSLCLAAHGLNGRPVGYMGIGGAVIPLLFAKAGEPLSKFLSAISVRPGEGRIRPLLLARALTLVLQLSRGRISSPGFTLKDETAAAARWLAGRKAAGGPALLVALASPAMRACLSAKEQGLDISGTAFRMSGEPFTSGKADVLAEAGARGIVTYVMSETGSVGVSCASPGGLDDLHVFTDRFVVLQRDKLTSSGDAVGALVYTTLSPSGTRLLLNVESGDYGTLRRRDCGCLLGDLGLDLHLGEVRSYEKLTSEGVTFIGSRLHDLVETVLPARFGGSGTDYQLVEEDGDQGLPKVSIVIAPGVGPVDDQAVVSAVLAALRAPPTGDPLWADLWARGQTLRVLRREPYKTRTAKVLPLHSLRSQDGR